MYYFCGVKLTVRYEAAAESSVFCAINLVSKNKRKEWGKSNRPEVFAQLNLTAPTALSFINVLN